MPSNISNVISNLRLPLMIMVVFIHSELSIPADMELFLYVERLFSKCIPVVAVPLFLFFAGYLFFNKFESFTFKFYKRQIKSRARTLLVPYLFWNSVVIVFFWSMHKFAPTLINPDFENISNFSFIQILDCYWRGSGGFPIAYQFWFIRDLMIIMVLSPIIYLFLRLRIIGLLICILAYFSGISRYIDIAVYFYLGAYCRIYRFDFTILNKKLILLLLCVTFCLLIVLSNIENNATLAKLYILSGSIVLLNLPILANSPCKRYKEISSGSFFLFCIHGIIVLLTCKLIAFTLHVYSQLLWCVVYFANIIFVVVFCLCLYYLTKKTFPKLLGITTGNR